MTTNAVESLNALLENPTVSEDSAIAEVAEQAASENNQSPEAVAEQEYGEVSKESAAVQKYSLGKAEDTIRFLKAAWTDFLSQILSRLGDTPENREFLENASMLLQSANLQTAYNGVQFMELFNYHINGQRPIDLGTLFVMNDFMRGFSNHVGAIPLNYLNVYDLDSTGASADPRLGFDPLPIQQLAADPANTKIPVKIETFTDIMYGYLEMFRYQKMIGDKPVTFLTDHPGVRIKDNYVAVNAIYRWCIVDTDTVKQAWYQGRSIVKKVVKSQATSNPIEDDTLTGTTANEDSKSES